MALNKQTLESAIRTAFETAKEEQWESAQVARALADAIDAFVRGAEVGGVVTKVEVRPSATVVHRGEGTQTGTVKLK